MSGKGFLSKLHSSADVSQASLSFSSATQSSFKRMKSEREANRNDESKLMAFFRGFYSNEMDISKLQHELAAKLAYDKHEKQVQETNKSKRSRHIIRRVLSTSYFREPTVHALKDIILMAKTGDIVLMKKATNFNFGSIDETVASGIRHCTQSNFISTSQVVQQWNHVGIVVELLNPLEAANLKRTNMYYNAIRGIVREVKYLLFADMNGIKLIELSQAISASLTANLPVSLRPLSLRNSDNSLEKLQEIGLVVLNHFHGSFFYDDSGSSLSRFRSAASLVAQDAGAGGGDEVRSRATTTGSEPSSVSQVGLRHKASMDSAGSGADADAGAGAGAGGGRADVAISPAAPTSTDNSTSATAAADALQDAQALHQFMAVVVERSRLTLMTHSAEDVAEARRGFFLMDTSGDGSLDFDEAMVLLGNYADNCKNAEDPNDQEAIRRQVEATRENLRQYLRSIDTDKNGLISLDEFVTAFKKIPVQVPNSNFDVQSVINAEFVACLLSACGVLRSEYTAEDICYLPHSFSSTVDASRMNSKSGGAAELTDSGSIPPLPEPSFFNSFFGNSTDRRQVSGAVQPLAADGDRSSSDATNKRPPVTTRYLNTRIHRSMLWNATLGKEILVKLV